MSVAIPLALLLGLFALGPILAHSLRRGSAQEQLLPTARFAVENQSSSRRRRTFSDRALLALRVLLILALALLAASPLAQLGSLSLSRKQGSSLAVAIVIDDSASMRVKAGGSVHFDAAVEAALQLVESAEEGDAISIVLAGKPARQHSAATRNIEAIRRSLTELTPTERETDLEGALVLANASLSGLLQADKQIIVLSDLAVSQEATREIGSIPIHYALPSLREPFENCAIVSAVRSGTRASVHVRCTSGAARGQRSVALYRQDPKSPRPKAFGASLLDTKIGDSEVLHLSIPSHDDLLPDARIVAVLEGVARDQISEDDSLELQVGDAGLFVGVQADPTRARAETSEKTVVELGLESLDSGVHVRILASLPETTDDLKSLAALAVDDPQGFSPEAQNALESWVRSGGVLFVLLGPAAASAPLSSGFWPVSRGFFEFRESARSLSLRAEDAKTDLGRGYDTLGVNRRATFDPIADSATLLSFDDGTPLLVERSLGRGLVLFTTLPLSISISDFSLRPGFLAILDRVLSEAQARSTTGPALPGAEWKIPPGYRVVSPGNSRQGGDRKERYVPEESGRIEVRGKDNTVVRVVGRHPAEVVRQPRDPEGLGPQERTEGDGFSPISRPVALSILALGVLELLVRRRRGTPNSSSAIGAVS